MLDLNEYLCKNPYPGRGILLGRSADNRNAVIAYFIMGRSENSRNRVFEETDDGIRTKAFDESKMTDPSLIIYHPVRLLDNGLLVVTNGDQTDTIRDHAAQGHCYRHGLHTREFEPDAPNYTPRISGVVRPDGAYNLSILKSLDGDPSCCCRYQENRDPLPSFEGEPRRVAVTAPDAGTLANELWANLNEENKVSLFVRYVDLESGQQETVIVNKHG